MSKSDVPVDLYIAAYMDPDGAQQDWDGLKQMVSDKVIDVDALVLVSRDANGKIHVKDDSRQTRHGATAGAVGGALVGLIFPPTLIAGAIVGGAIGGGAGAVLKRVERKRVKADVEATLPNGSSAIVALIEERWVGDLEKALVKADRYDLHHIHGGDDDDEDEPAADTSDTSATPAPTPAAASASTTD